MTASAQAFKVARGHYLVEADALGSTFYVGATPTQMAAIALGVGERIYLTVTNTTYVDPGDGTITRLPEGVLLSHGGYGAAESVPITPGGGHPSPFVPVVTP